MTVWQAGQVFEGQGKTGRAGANSGFTPD